MHEHNVADESDLHVSLWPIRNSLKKPQPQVDYTTEIRAKTNIPNIRYISSLAFLNEHSFASPGT